MKRIYFLTPLFFLFSCQEPLKENGSEQDLNEAEETFALNFFSTNEFKMAKFELQITTDQSGESISTRSNDGIFSKVECKYDKNRNKFSVVMESLTTPDSIFGYQYWLVKHFNFPNRNDVIEQFDSESLYFSSNQSLYRYSPNGGFSYQEGPKRISYGNDANSKSECFLEYGEVSESYVSGRLACKMEPELFIRHEVYVDARFICETPEQ